MTKDKLNQDEKATLLGIQAVLNFDICSCFDCAIGGCDNCPLQAIAQAQEEFMSVINKAVSK